MLALDLSIEAFACFGRVGAAAALVFDPALTAPSATLATGQTEYPPQVNLSFDDTADVALSPVIRWEDRSKTGTVTATGTHTITGPEAAANAASIGLTAITTGTNRLYFRIEQAGKYSSWSSEVLQGPDDVEPVLSAATSSSIAATSAKVGVTTDTAEGTLYVIVSANSGTPTKAQVAAGQTAGGASATYASSQAVSSSGAKTFNATGLPSTTTEYYFFMHVDAAGNQSPVIGGNFTTTAVVTPAFSWTDNPAGQDAAGAASVTYASVAIGAADTTRVVVVGMSLGAGNELPDSVTIGGVTATQIDTELSGALYAAAVPTGTTADVVINRASGWNKSAINVGRMVGCVLGTGSPLSAAFNFSDPSSVSPTIGGGGGVAVALIVAEGGSRTISVSAGTAGLQTQYAALARTIKGASRTNTGSITFTGQSTGGHCIVGGVFTP